MTAIAHIQPIPRMSLRAGLAAFAFVAILVLGTGLLLMETSLVTSAGYDNARLVEEKRALEHDTQRLEAEVASLRSLDHVEAEARSKLGMVNATSYLYIQVDPNLKGR